MKYYKKMVGEKCYLSPISIDDAGKYTGWLNDLDVSKNLSNAVQNISLHSEKEILQKLVREHAYAIVSIGKDGEDKLIGNCSFMNINHIHRRAEVGIFIGDKSYWSKGYGTEALNLLLKYGFNYLNFRNVWLCVYSFNERAIKSYKKVGFKEIGRRRSALTMNRKEYDIVYMDILDDEFLSE